MDTFLLRVFQQQIQLQCEAVLVGSHEFESAMLTQDLTRAWIAIQNILTAAANISKALWGQAGKLAEQRKPLRESLQIDDTSPLRDVVMRNHFEHYDDRLDEWWKKSAQHNHFDMSALPPDTVKGLADIDMFRVFDPQTSDIVFWGQRFNLRELVQAAAQLLAIARTESAKPHWDPPPESPSTSGSGQ